MTKGKKQQQQKSKQKVVFEKKAFKKFVFILFQTTLGFRCCVQAFSGCGEWVLLFSCGTWVLFAVASLVVEHELQSMGSAVVIQGLCCPAACGLFLNQGSNLYVLHGRGICNYCITSEVSEKQVFLVIYLFCLENLWDFKYFN